LYAHSNPINYTDVSGRRPSYYVIDALSTVVELYEALELANESEDKLIFGNIFPSKARIANKISRIASKTKKEIDRKLEWCGQLLHSLAWNSMVAFGKGDIDSITENMRLIKKYTRKMQEEMKTFRLAWKKLYQQSYALISRGRELMNLSESFIKSGNFTSMVGIVYLRSKSIEEIGESLKESALIYRTLFLSLKKMYIKYSKVQRVLEKDYLK
jgi:hypothetical protein